MVMKKKIIFIVLGIVILLGILAISAGQAVLAISAVSDNFSILTLGEEQPELVEKVTIFTSFPVVRGESGTSFEYEFEIRYEGHETRVFELEVTPPEGWTAAIKRRFKSDEPSVLAIRINPEDQRPEYFTAILTPFPGTLPEPGEYLSTLEVSSGAIIGKLELTAVITDKPPNYDLDLATPNGKLDARVIAGEKNYVPFSITNVGNATIEDVVFSGVKSDGWKVTFEPSKFDFLEPEQSERVTATIIPPRETIAGDYNVLIRSMGKGVSDQLSMRIKVRTSTYWGWLSGGIAAAIIASIAIVFRRLGRR